MRITTARIAGFSRSAFSSRTTSSTSMMMPSSSTMATRGPNRAGPPSPLRAPPTTMTNRPATARNTSSAAPTIVSRRPTLVLVFVVVVRALLSLPPPPAGAAGLVGELRWRRDRVGQLLQAEADAALGGIDADDQQGQLVAHVDDLGRGRHRAVGHLRDVQQPVHPGLQLDERPEVGQVADLAADAVADAIAFVDGRPRVGLDLLHAERDPLGGPVDVEDDHVDLVADVDDLRRVPHPARPRHLGDVY